MQTLRAWMIAVPLTVVVAVVGALVFIVTPGEQDGAGATSSAGTTVAWDLDGGRFLFEVQDGPGRAFEVTSRFESDSGSDHATLIQPSVSMTMVGHQMGRTTIPLSRRSDGAWHGTGNFPMSGPWRFQVIFDGDVIKVEHTAR